VLLGAVLAPTDPVLAADVRASEPLEEVGEEIEPTEQEESVRFGLTSEAGLNDGLAFPFTDLAIAMAAASGTAGLAWFGEWLLVDVAYKIVVGILGGYAGGRLLAALIFGEQATSATPAATAITSSWV
jgi:NhaP-type Na+/H+ or K+/H+ antiporter